MHNFYLSMTAVVLLASLAHPALAEDSVYVERIRPLLKERCYACHGALKQEAGLRLDTGTLVRKGSENGLVVDIAAAEQSPLLDRLLSDDDDYRMPPDGKPLTAEEVEHFRQWIANGAQSPENETPEPDPSDHWAFRVPVRPAMPDLQGDDWSRNPIDQLIRQRHQSLGLQPASDAAPERLLRRVTLDLIGIPPTPQQLQDFVNDPSPKRYEQVVEQLLTSPQYGERWARHWMDVWRYSDWYGRRQQNDVRNSAPQIWRWRDWIVDSLNGDKSYARMIQEMLAADEIAADDDSAWPATGYLIRSYYSLNPNEWMRHNVEYTGKAFLGLTFNCAHCHDHKYDPILHDDYFRMRAFFEPMGIRQDRVVGAAEPPPFEPYVYGGSRLVMREGMVRIYDEQPEAPTWFYTGGDERNKVKERGSIAPGVPAFLDIPFPEITPVELPMSGWYPGSRRAIQQQVLAENAEEISAATAALSAAQDTNIDTTPFVVDVDQAQTKYDAALQQARAAGEAGALAGRQSLLLDATSGRRIVQHALPNLQDLPDGTTIGFQLGIIQDGHFNFQLARDTSKSLTALYLAFEGGMIKAYRPGSFSVFVLGEYAQLEGPHVLDVSLCVHPATDVVTVDIAAVSASDRATLVSQVDIALNAWNPAKNEHQPFTFDCRPGTQVLIDNVSVVAGGQSWQWDFEPPAFPDGQEIAGIQGWLVHQLSAGKGTSVVSSIAGCRSALDEYEQLKTAEAALLAANSELRAAELRLAAANQQAVSLQATIAVDNAQRDAADAEVVKQLSREARSAQLTARETNARWRILDAERQLAALRLPAATDKEAPAENDKAAHEEKAKRIKQVEKSLASARKDLHAVSLEIAKSADSVEYQRLSRTTSPQSTGRRSALAAWIVHPGNPLTPRVAVNHIWLRHFHAPLVESVYDFGRNGKAPTHPELLDWLAVELLENNWSMKHMHRLIVTSRTYQMTSSGLGLDKNLAHDQENRQLWRMNAGRMEAEVVRDSVLAVAGVLDPTVGGEVQPNTAAMTTFRRSLYYEVYPESGGNNALAEVFDAPDPGECFRRTSTVMPQQALALSNSKLIHSAAKLTTAEIAKATGEDNDAFIRRAFQRILSRRPSDREVAAATSFLQQQVQQAGTAEAARESLVRVLFNHNDFVTVR